MYFIKPFLLLNGEGAMKVRGKGFKYQPSNSFLSLLQFSKRLIGYRGDNKSLDELFVKTAHSI